MQFGRCDILNLLAEVPVTADEGWRWEISKVPRPGKFSPIKRRKSNGNVFTYFILLMATKWTQGFPMVAEKGSIPGRKDWENCWDGCFGIWLVEKAKRKHSNLSLRPQLCVWPWISHLLWLGLIFPIWDGGLIKEEVRIWESCRLALEPWCYHLLTAALYSRPTCTYDFPPIKWQ